MSREFAELLARRFSLPEGEKNILEKNVRQLSRLERRIYFERIKPREKEFKHFLKAEHSTLGGEGRQRWVNLTVQSLLEKGGDPDLVDSMVMDVLGRLEIYRALREKAEKEGRRLKALTNFGGLPMVLILFTIIAALIIYLSGR